MTPQEQELPQRWILEADRLIDEGDRHFDVEAYLAAEPLSRQALALRQAALGKQHEEVAVALNRLANVGKPCVIISYMI